MPQFEGVNASPRVATDSSAVATTSTAAAGVTHPRLSVVVPAFQEEGRLKTTIRDLCATLNEGLGAAFEIVIVDDGSTDATFEEAALAADACDRCRVVSYPRNRGKGHALRRGFASARGDLVAFCDADGEISGRTLLSLVRAVDGDVSAVVGRRRWQVARPWHRRLASVALARFARLVFDLPVAETQAGAKVFVRADVTRAVAQCREDGYLFDLELLVRLRARNLRMTSVDIVQTRTRAWRIGPLAGLREVAPVWRIWRELRAPAARRPAADPVAGSAAAATTRSVPPRSAALAPSAARSPQAHPRLRAVAARAVGKERMP